MWCLDIFGLDADQAQERLLDAARRPAPAVTPGSPPTLPAQRGGLPRIWNVPARTALFTGRQAQLEALATALHAGAAVAVHALHGLGGVGKTQLAIEYAYRHAAEYDLVWWVNAEQPGLIGEQFATLAGQAGVAELGTATPAAVAAAQAMLRQRDRWLVIFDNAPRKEDVAEWVPQGPGHVVIASRRPAWSGVATPVSVDVFSRTESVALLRGQLPALSGSDADALAARLGDLPLALAQAAGVMSKARMPVTEYVALVTTTTAAVLSHGVPVGYPHRWPLGPAGAAEPGRRRRRRRRAGPALRLAGPGADPELALHRACRRSPGLTVHSGG